MIRFCHLFAIGGCSVSNVPEGATLSEDGSWWWDGAEWQPVQYLDSGSADAGAGTDAGRSDGGAHVGKFVWYGEPYVEADSGDCYIWLNIMNMSTVESGALKVHWVPTGFGGVDGSHDENFSTTRNGAYTINVKVAPGAYDVRQWVWAVKADGSSGESDYRSTHVVTPLPDD